ncbi:MAG: HD-GYP domain-containing protein, partial [Thermoanaerobaculia bacterium]
NDRMLATPLFSRGRLVGFIDMRDKAGKKPFDTPDLAAASKIAEQMIQVLALNKLYGLAPIALVEDPSRRNSSPQVVAAIDTPTVRLQPGQALSSEAAKSIEAARQYMSRRQLNAAANQKRILGEPELEVIRLLLPAALAIPGAVMAAFSAIGHLGNPQIIVARSNVTQSALEALDTHLQAWLRRTNLPVMAMKPQVVVPFATTNVPLEATSIGRMFSAAVHAPGMEGLVMTVGFDYSPDTAGQRALHIFLKQLESAVENALAPGHSTKQLTAERLLEPDFQKYPELAEHSRDVSALAHRFAKALELNAQQAETVRLAALVHDVGLRLLDYERLYRKMNLTAEELRGLGEHPVVGAALVEPLLGPDVAQAVLRHHERVDGKGYPSRLSGQQIPLASRILQICDAWIAMTGRQSYQPPISREQAQRRLREGAGSQFDAALVERFLKALPEIGM